MLAADLVHAAALSSSVNRNTIGINETLTLLVTFADQVSTDQLNLGSLKNDFEVLSARPQSSSNMSVVNGKVTRQASTTWTILLAPRREGRLLIPTFSLADQTSNAITIQVITANVVPASKQPLLVTLSVDHNEIYLGQQMFITLTLSAIQSVRDLSGDPLSILGAHIEPLDQQTFQRIDNGIARQVVVLKYALFANDAGEITIPSQMFRGVIGSRRSIFDSFNSQQAQQVIARSKALKVKVNNKPDSSNDPWFPAKNVSIKSSWSGDTKSARVGVPITRIIKITAEQQRASVIPPLKRDAQTSYKTYSDQPQLENTISAQGIIGTRLESEAIVPSQSGELLLPEIKLRWWNTNTKQWQTTVLAAETLIVSPALATTVNESAPVIPVAMGSANSDQDQVDNNWKWLALFFAGLSFVLLLIIFKLRSQLNGTNATTNSKQIINKTESANWNQLQKSFKSKDIKLIRNNLLDWAQSAFIDNKVNSVQTLIDSVGSLLTNNDKIKTELTALNRQLYNDKTESKLNIKILSTELTQLRKALNNREPDSKSHSLAPLYPE